MTEGLLRPSSVEQPASKSLEPGLLLRRQHLRGQFEALFDHIDVLLAPVQPFAPLSLDRVRNLGEQPRLIADLQRSTAPFDLTGGPSLALPGGVAPNGLPIGIQRIAPNLKEAVLIR